MFLLSHSPVPFVSEELLVGLGWGNRDQAHSDFVCGYLVCIFSLFNIIFKIMPAIVLPLYIFDCSVQPEFEWWSGALILEETEFFRRLPSPLWEKSCLQDEWNISLTIKKFEGMA